MFRGFVIILLVIYVRQRQCVDKFGPELELSSVSGHIWTLLRNVFNHRDVLTTVTGLSYFI